jgi:hypothetical protein
LNEGTAALVVVGIDNDAELIEDGAMRSKRHVLKREFGDFDEAEQEALVAIEHSERTG